MPGNERAPSLDGAPDPVTACTTKKGQLIYGAAIGLLVLVIRNWGGYPDAVAFAVLLMNMAAPSIDYYTQPRVYGHEEEEDTLHSHSGLSLPPTAGIRRRPSGTGWC